MDTEHAAILDNSPMIERIGSDDRAHNLGPAVANHAGDAENLASANRKAHICENASPRQAVYGENGVAARVNASREQFVELSPEHQLDELRGIHNLRASQSFDVATAAQ